MRAAPVAADRKQASALTECIAKSGLGPALRRAVSSESNGNFSRFASCLFVNVEAKTQKAL
ncbi:unnamed protein product, partial [Amoebophrya sp. A25]|eukprot:GSA25T00007708001.1